MATNPNAIPENSDRIIAPTPAYPYGSAKNDSTGTTGDGTPIIQPYMNDIYGYQQWLLATSGIVPSGNADTALISQYGDAMNRIRNTVIQDGVATFAVASGTANAIILTPTTPYLNLVAGTTVVFKATATNTGASTILLGTQPIKNAKVNTPLGKRNTVANQVVIDGVYIMVYDGVDLVLMNPSSLQSLFVNIPSLTGPSVLTDGLAPSVLVYSGVGVTGEVAWFNSILNRLTPSIPGRFIVECTASVSGATYSGANNSLAQTELTLYKNGANLRPFDVRSNYKVTSPMGSTLMGGSSNPVEMNGTSDYFQLFGSLVSSTGGSTININSSVVSMRYLGS